MEKAIHADDQLISCRIHMIQANKSIQEIDFIVLSSIFSIYLY